MSDFSLSREKVRELDRRAAEEYELPGIVLMENAGRGCAELLMALNPTCDPTAILCGPGNNGGDGFVMARHLDNRGWPVEVYAVEVPAEQRSGVVRLGWSFDGLPPDALVNFRVVSSSKIDLFPLSRTQLYASTQNHLADRIQRRNGWIVDALFGTGLSRALDGPFVELVALINSSGNPVLAIDIPSGLDCDTGEPLGPAVKATHTATFVAPKLGFRNANARAWTGDVHVIDIGAPRKLVDSYRD